MFGMIGMICKFSLALAGRRRLFRDGREKTGPAPRRARAQGEDVRRRPVANLAPIHYIAAGQDGRLLMYTPGRPPPPPENK